MEEPRSSGDSNSDPLQSKMLSYKHISEGGNCSFYCYIVVRFIKNVVILIHNIEEDWKVMCDDVVSKIILYKVRVCLRLRVLNSGREPRMYLYSIKPKSDLFFLQLR